MAKNETPRKRRNLGKSDKSKGIRRVYDEKTVENKKSTERQKYKRARNLVIAVWLIICLIAGVLFYSGYAKEKYSDNPRIAISETSGTKTGVPLDENRGFGLWNGNDGE